MTQLELFPWMPAGACPECGRRRPQSWCRECERRRARLFVQPAPPRAPSRGSGARPSVRPSAPSAPPTRPARAPGERESRIGGVIPVHCDGWVAYRDRVFDSRMFDERNVDAELGAERAGNTVLLG
jgi:hypothetical protein